MKSKRLSNRVTARLPMIARKNSKSMKKQFALKLPTVGEFPARHVDQPTAEIDGAELATLRVSEIRYVRRRMIANHEWVEALHAGSEVPNYDTYYLATITSDLGVLVTMSVHKDHSDKYIGQLNDMIATLNIYQR